MTLLDETVELVDNNKIVRIRLGLDDSGNAFLSLNDADGLERVKLHVDGDGNAGLGFRSANGQPTVTLGVSSEIGLGMMMLDVPNETCLRFTVANGRGKILLETKDDVHAWPANSNKNP